MFLWGGGGGRECKKERGKDQETDSGPDLPWIPFRLKSAERWFHCVVDNMPALRAEGTPGIDSQRNHIPLMAPPLWQPVSITSHIANFPIVERISHSIINIILTKK